MKTLLAATAALAAVAAGAILPVAAQIPSDAPLPKFEASIKRAQDNSGMMSMRMDPMGRTMTGLALRNLIVQSYGIQQNQLVGGPEWVTTDRWDIQLRADAPITPPQANLLIQQMLADRFKLVLKRETRELPLYELTFARPDKQLGPGLTPAAIDCGPQGRGRAGMPPPPAGAVGRDGGPGGPGRGPAPLAGCRMMFTMGRIEGNGQPISGITSFLSSQLGRLVIDKTGLTGGYDITLSWTPDGFRAGGPGPPLPPGAPAPPPIDPDGPPLVTALQEQLGLRVEPTKGPVEVLVIDSVQQPSEN
jgi:uncharacterized protein (TIGR03435 family)